MESNNTEMKMQYILDENKNLAEIPLTDMLPVEHPIKCKLISAFEVFVRVPQTENYWISNYGRGVNNHRNPNMNNSMSISKENAIILFMKCGEHQKKSEGN